MDPKALRALIDRLNLEIDTLVPFIIAFLLLFYVLIFTRNKICKDGSARGIVLGTLALVEITIVFTAIYLVPIFVSNLIPNLIDAPSFRWVMIYLTLIPLWYRTTRNNSGLRGVFAVTVLLTTFLLGWFYDRWMGILFISIPIVGIFFHAAGSMAQAILPANEPEDRQERRQKSRAFLMYLLGIQHPFRMAEATAGRNIEVRIPGNSTYGFSKPGIVWTWPHQVSGISRGIEFDTVDGPGIIFTGQFESPVALVDLRTQLRVSNIDTVTKDGMNIRAVVFLAFAIDRDAWPKKNWSRADTSKLRYHHPKSFELDHTQGNYPYSSGRIFSILSTSGVVSTNNPGEGEKSEFFWDDWILKQAEHATRQVVSERSLDELWHPLSAHLGVSALSEMAANIKELLAPRLLEYGINLFTVRIVNYEIDEKSDIATQNLRTWSSMWEQKVIEANADVEIIYREEIEKAHAYAKSILLNVIAESLEKARNINEELPRHVIAQYYVHALEEYMKKQPGLNIEESKKRLEALKDFLFYNRTEGPE